MSHRTSGVLSSRLVRFATVTLSVAAIALGAGCEKTPPATGGSPPKTGEAARKPLTVGFAQIGAESTWRTANTDSIKGEADKRGVQLKFTDAQQKQENQIKALHTFIAQKVDVIVFSPVVTTGWEPVLREAKAANIPVVICDRAVDTKDESLYAAFIGFDCTEQGRAAARWLIEKSGGKAGIVELQGTPGAEPAIERGKGFAEVLAGDPKAKDLKVLRSQTGDFNRAKGREVMEAFLKSPIGPQITAVFAHNDDMALGAIQAIEAAGKKPGTDILIVSVDAVRDAFEAMKQGKLNCTVECSPLIGPVVFDTVEKVARGEAVQKRTLIKPEVFPQETAEKVLPTRKY
ncbi:MAG: ABC transporter substrate-binding protein [Phycisphaerales bacterium]